MVVVVVVVVVIVVTLVCTEKKHNIQNLVMFILIHDSLINRLLKYTVKTGLAQLLY